MRTIIRLKESFQSDFKATLEKAKEFDTHWVKGAKEVIRDWETRRTSLFEDYSQEEFI
jgi:hypothetical protein